MKTLFVIPSGGAGKILSSVPAFLKYARSTTEDFYIQIPGWKEFIWGYKELEERTYQATDPFLFDTVYSKVDQVIAVDPYNVPDFYMERIHVTEAFDRIINPGNDTPLDFNIPVLQNEDRFAKLYLQKNKSKPRTVVIQPWGSTMSEMDGEWLDETLRSIPVNFYDEIVKGLEEHCDIFFMGGEDFHRGNTILDREYNLNLRCWTEIIRRADYFIGCDSVGQHIAKFVGTPASVLFAGTNSLSFGYEDHHHIEKDIPHTINMFGVLQDRGELAQRLNHDRIMFNDAEIEFIVSQLKTALDL